MSLRSTSGFHHTLLELSNLLLTTCYQIHSDLKNVSFSDPFSKFNFMMF